MNKTKITSIVIISLLVGIGAVNFTGAYEIDGSIDVEVKNWVGLVSPKINIGNQTAPQILVNRTLKDKNYTNMVEDSLIIPINIVDNKTRSTDFLLPRPLFYMVFVTRDGEKLLPLGGFINRIMPAKAFGSVSVVNSTLGERDTNITVKLRYMINNDTFNAGENSNQGENFTVKIFAMGFLPGEANGGVENLPIIAKGEFKLINITYKQKYNIPMAPINFTAEEHNSTQINLSWTNGLYATHTYIEYNSTAGPWTRGEGTVLYNNTGNKYQHTGLDTNTTYYYQAWSYNVLDNCYSDSVSADATTEESI